MFYKGGALGRLESVFRADGSLDFVALGSTPPTEFSYYIKGLYLTKQAEVAWKYAQWAAQVVDGKVVPIGILQVAIPIPLLASTYELVGSDWRAYVWACRYQERAPPKNMDFISNYKWIVGPLCKQGQHQIKKMKDASELVMWRLDSGQPAHQVYAAIPKMLGLLAEHCAGKVWVTSIASKNDN